MIGAIMFDIPSSIYKSDNIKSTDFDLILDLTFL